MPPDGSHCLTVQICEHVNVQLKGRHVPVLERDGTPQIYGSVQGLRD